MLWLSEHKGYGQISVHQKLLVSQQGLLLFNNSYTLIKFTVTLVLIVWLELHLAWLRTSHRLRRNTRFVND